MSPTKTQKWKFKTAGGTKGGEVYSSAAIAYGLDCFGSEDGKFYALNIKTEQEEWRFQTGGMLLHSPAIADALIYVGSIDENLYAVDISTGQQKWKYKTGGQLNLSPKSGRFLIHPYFKSILFFCH